jgi:transposase
VPAPLKISLSKEEDRQLLKLQQHSQTPSRVRYRAEIVRLNAHGWSVSQIAKYQKLSSHTVRKSIHDWSNYGLEGLWEAGGRGRKRSWQEKDIQYLEACLEQEQRTYNSRQLAEKLKQDRGVKLSPDRIRKLLKKRGGDGREPGINHLQPPTQNTKKPNKPI